VKVLARRKSNKTLFWVIFALAVAAGLWYYYTMPEAPAPAQPVSPPSGIQTGDLATINFVMSMTNGTVVDTNNEAVAKEYGIGTYTKGPYKFIVGQSGKVKGFDHAITGMEPGKNYTRIIAPSEQVVQYAVNRTRTVSRNQPLPRYQPFPFSVFEKKFGKKPVLNDVVTSAEIPWPYKVINITEGYAICDPVVKEGKSYKLPSLDWNSTLLVVTYNDLLFRHNPVEGQEIDTEFGKATVHPDVGRINITYQAKLGDVVKYSIPLESKDDMVMPYTFRVTESNDQYFTITRTDYLPQETLVLKVEVLDWQKDIKQVSGEPIGTAKIS
jgi:FKBP-type peptidyl-prolyl cis-trans isomerase 2